MRLLQLKLGDRQLQFGTSTSARLPFSFPAPVDGAYALLQSVYLNREDRDVQLDELRVAVRTLFDPLQSRTEGEVQVDIQFEGSGGWSPFISSDLIRAEVQILVVGV